MTVWWWQDDSLLSHPVNINCFQFGNNFVEWVNCRKPLVTIAYGARIKFAKLNNDFNFCLPVSRKVLATLSRSLKFEFVIYRIPRRISFEKQLKIKFLEWLLMTKDWTWKRMVIPIIKQLRTLIKVIKKSFWIEGLRWKN